MKGMLNLTDVIKENKLCIKVEEKRKKNALLNKLYKKQSE